MDFCIDYPSVGRGFAPATVGRNFSANILALIGAVGRSPISARARSTVSRRASGRSAPDSAESGKWIRVVEIETKKKRFRDVDEKMDVQFGNDVIGRSDSRKRKRYIYIYIYAWCL